MSNEETLYARFISGKLTEDETEELKRSGDWDKLEAITGMVGRFIMPEIDKKTGFERLKATKGKHKKPRARRLLLTRLTQGVAASLIFATTFYFIYSNSRGTP